MNRSSDERTMGDRRARSPQRSSASGFLPDFCALPFVLGLLITGELLSLVLILASGGGLDFWERFGLLSLYVQLIALSAATLLCLLRTWLARLDHWLAALLAWLLILAVTLLITWLSYRLLPLREPDLLIRAPIISAIVAALFLRYLYLHHLWRVQVEAEAEARFQSLQARIRPHFLFNSLNTIANLIQTRPRLAEALLEDLADLLRASLSQERIATLGEELELVRQYLHIEERRLGPRLQVRWALAPDLPEQARLPRLSLQPLVENAVHHGIAPARHPGPLLIRGEYRRGHVILEIENDRPEARTREPAHHHGIGLENVRQRLEALYPAGTGRVRWTAEGGRFRVRLQFPYPWRDR